jgi:TPR repeat protein
MKQIIRSIGLAVYFVAIKISIAANPDPPHQRCDRGCLEARAMSGDAAAALAMADAMLKIDHGKMVYWYRIAAEDGSKLGQFNYATFLVLDSKNRNDCIRAAFWFGRAAAQRDADAKRAQNALLAKLAIIDEFKVGCNGVL